MKKPLMLLIGAALLISSIGGAHAFTSREANCHLLKFESGNLTTVMDAMMNPQTKESQQIIMSDYLRAVKAFFYTYLKCNGHNDMRWNRN